MYGIDTISCGATIAWAMECFEKGILTKEQTDGLELKYGNGAVFDALIKKIACKEKGIGELLAKRRKIWSWLARGRNGRRTWCSSNRIWRSITRPIPLARIISRPSTIRH